MFLRLSVVAALCLLPFMGGCSCCRKAVGPCPPKFKVCNPQRLFVETLWFYADVQDTVFGVNYYEDMEAKYGSGPYHK